MKLLTQWFCKWPAVTCSWVWSNEGWSVPLRSCWKTKRTFFPLAFQTNYSLFFNMRTILIYMLKSSSMAPFSCPQLWCAAHTYKKAMFSEQWKNRSRHGPSCSTVNLNMVVWVNRNPTEEENLCSVQNKAMLFTSNYLYPLFLPIFPSFRDSTVTE